IVECDLKQTKCDIRQCCEEDVTAGLRMHAPDTVRRSGGAEVLNHASPRLLVERSAGGARHDNVLGKDHRAPDHPSFSAAFFPPVLDHWYGYSWQSSMKSVFTRSRSTKRPENRPVPIFVL